MAFYARCYNGHKVLVEEDWEGMLVECPECHEDFIVSRIDVREELPRNSEQYWRSTAFVTMISGFVLAGIGVGLGHWVHEVVGWLIGVFGGIIALRGLGMLFFFKDIFSWLLTPIKRWYWKRKR